MQILAGNSSSKIPGLSTLKPGGSSFTPVDKPTGYGPSGYAAAPAYPRVGTTPQTPVDKPTGVGPTGYGATPTTTAKKTPATAPATTTTQTSGDPSQSIYNLDTDPIVARIKALNAQNYANAVSGAQASAKQNLVDSGFSFGDILTAHPELAQGILGSVLGDQTTQLAAQQNPYSTAKQLFGTHDQNVNQIDQADNAANLYYSSTRGNQQGDEAKAYLGNVSGAEGQLSSALGSLIQNVQQEKANEDLALANAYDQARQNEVTNAINSGEVLLGYDGNGNPVFGHANNGGGGGGTTGGTGGTGGTGSTGGTGGTGAAAAVAALTHPQLAVQPAQVLAKVVAANKTGATAAKGRGVITIH